MHEHWSQVSHLRLLFFAISINQAILLTPSTPPPPQLPLPPRAAAHAITAADNTYRSSPRGQRSRGRGRKTSHTHARSRCCFGLLGLLISDDLLLFLSPPTLLIELCCSCRRFLSQASLLKGSGWMLMEFLSCEMAFAENNGIEL